MEQAEKAARALANVGGEAMTAQREKNWSELGIEEKVERLRHETRRVRELAEYAARTATQALELARGHQHGARGEVLVAINDGRNHGRNLVAGSEGRGYDPLR